MSTTQKFKVFFSLATFILLQGCGGSSNSTTDTIPIKQNLPPEVSIVAPIKAISGETVILTAEIIEPEKQDFTIEWSVEKGDSNILSSTNKEQTSFFVPLIDIDTEIELMVKVTDSEGLVTSKNTIIEIPAAYITLTTTDNFQALKKTSIVAETLNIKMDSFTSHWEVNGEIKNSDIPHILTYQPTLGEHSNELSIKFTVNEANNSQVTSSMVKTIAPITANFNIPYKPISLRYVTIEANFDNLNLENVKLKWQITNGQQFDLENSGSKNLQFYAKNQLANHENFQTTQTVDLSLTLSHHNQQLIFPTSVTIDPVDNVPQWPIHEIPQVTKQSPIPKEAKKFKNIKANHQSLNEKHLDFNNDGFIDYLHFEKGVVSYYQAIDNSTYSTAVEVLTNVYVDFRLGQEFDIDNNDLMEFYIFERNDDEFGFNQFSRFYYEQKQEKIAYEIISDIAVPYTLATNNDPWQPYMSSFQLLQKESQLYLLTTHINKDNWNGHCYFGCETWFTSQILSLTSESFSITHTESIWQYTPSNEFTYFDKMVLSDLNEDGIEDIVIEGKTAEYFEIDYYTYEDVAVLDGSGNYPVSILGGQGYIFQKNIDEDNYLEWIYSGYQTSYGGVSCNINYYLTLENGALTSNPLGSCPSEINVFSNLNTQANTTASTASNLNGYIHLYNYTSTHNYCIGRDAYGCYYYQTYSPNSFFTFEDKDNATPLLLTREPYQNNGIERLSNNQKSEFQLIDMDNDGDLDIKGLNWWLENNESLPIIVSKEE